MERFFWTCFAGALGTGARYLFGLWATQRFASAFPYGTLIVNVSGSFLLSIIMQVALHTEAISPTLRLALTVGFLGGLTTYSSFNYEATTLFQAGERGPALAYYGLTTILSLVAGLAGLAFGERLAGA